MPAARISSTLSPMCRLSSAREVRGDAGAAALVPRLPLAAPTDTPASFARGFFRLRWPKPNPFLHPVYTRGILPRWAGKPSVSDGLPLSDQGAERRGVGSRQTVRSGSRDGRRRSRLQSRGSLKYDRGLEPDEWEFLDKLFMVGLPCK